MKSIRTKFLVLMLACVLLSAAAFAWVGSYTASALAEEDSVQIMNLLCEEQAKEMDMMLLSVEQAVNTVSRYAEGQLSAIGDINEEKIYFLLSMKKTKELAFNVAENTSGTTAVYVCLEPDFSASVDGFCLVRGDEQEKLEESRAISIPEDIETEDGQNSWYEKVVQEDLPVWAAPHQSIADGKNVVSYVVPLHKDGTVVGLIGMDVEMQVLKDYVDSVQIYDTGYAFLGDKEKNIYYHRDYPDGVQEEEVHGNMRQVMRLLADGEEEDSLYDYRWEEEQKKLTFCTLRNGMLLILTAPKKEIYAAQHRMAVQSLVVLAIIIVISVLLTSQVTKRIIRPLKELTKAAEMVAGGDLSVSIECSTRDEVGVLAKSFEQTVKSLKQHIDYINKLAYTDAMTGAMNKMAYKETVASMEKQMEKGMAEFAVVVMDINNLKKINDNFGHEFGDMLIRDSASIIQRTFKESTIYRIGGDEFVIILKSGEVKKTAEFLSTFQEEITRFNRNNTKYEQKVQIAIGIAAYIPGEDKSFQTVFRRADSVMYENKIALKEAEKQA